MTDFYHYYSLEKEQTFLKELMYKYLNFSLIHKNIRKKRMFPNISLALKYIDIHFASVKTFKIIEILLRNFHISATIFTFTVS